MKTSICTFFITALFVSTIAAQEHLPITLEASMGNISSLAFDPQGKILASVSKDIDIFTIKLWDPATGSLIKTIGERKQMVQGIAFDSDGRDIAICENNNTIKVVRIDDGKTTLTIKESSPASCITFSPNGKYIVTGNDDVITLWGAANGKQVRTLKGHTDRVRCISFNPAGDLLASGSADNSIILWDMETGTQMKTMTGHTDVIFGLAFNSEGRMLASAGKDTDIKVWRVSTGQLVRTYKSHSAPVTSVFFSPDGRELLSGSWDATIRIWNVATGELLRTIEAHDQPISTVVSPIEGNIFVSGARDGTIKIWRTMDFRELWPKN